MKKTVSKKTKRVIFLKKLINMKCFSCFKFLLHLHRNKKRLARRNACQHRKADEIINGAISSRETKENTFRHT